MEYEEPKFTEYGLTQWYWLVRHRENFKLGKDVQIGNFTVIGCEYGVEIQDNVKIINLVIHNWCNNTCSQQIYYGCNGSK